MSNASLDQDCAVCLQKCHHPTQLPCGHVFCFLCVKGVAIQSKRCAMCRAEIPPDYLEHPVLLEKNDTEQLEEQHAIGEHQWYYEGRNGWWKYDERSNTELEAAYNAGETECSLLLAGALYRIDFEGMVQVRRSDHTRRRRVRRDVPTLPAKGVAGIKKPYFKPTIQEDEDNSNDDTNNSNPVEVIEIIDEDDDEIGIVTESEEVSDIIRSISSINLQDAEVTHREVIHHTPE